MAHHTNAMGGRKLIVLPERPAGEPSLLIGTTLIAAALAGLFAIGCLVSILLSSPPEASDAMPPASSSPARGDVEAVASGYRGAGR